MVRGYEAEAAYSGAEALKKVERSSLGSAQDRPFGFSQDRPFDCVLTDIKMPEVVEIHRRELHRVLRA